MGIWLLLGGSVKCAYEVSEVVTNYLLILLTQVLQQSVELVFIYVPIAILRVEKRSRYSQHHPSMGTGE